MRDKVFQNILHTAWLVGHRYQLTLESIVNFIHLQGIQKSLTKIGFKDISKMSLIFDSRDFFVLNETVFKAEINIQKIKTYVPITSRLNKFYHLDIHPSDVK